MPVEFIGRGEVRGHIFKHIKMTDKACIYAVWDTSGTKRYEVFKKVVDRRFNRIAYPKQKAWGMTAWTAKSLERAIARFEMISSDFKPTNE